MANETTTTTLDDLLPSIVAEAMFQAQEASIMRGLVKNYTLPAGSGKTITVPKYAAVTAADLTEGTAVANTAVSTDGATLTVAEVGVMATVTDMARRTSAANVIGDVGTLLGRSIAKKMDQDLIALFDGFSTAIGDGTTAITAAKIFEAVAKLRANEVPAQDIACVLHPNIAYDLKSSMTNTFATATAGGVFGGDLANEAMRTGYVGQLAGVPVFEAASMANSGNAGDYKGAVFHMNAIGLATMQDISIETERDAALRGDKLVATAVYGVGELFDNHGVELHFDSSIQ